MYDRKPDLTNEHRIRDQELLCYMLKKLKSFLRLEWSKIIPFHFIKFWHLFSIHQHHHSFASLYFNVSLIVDVLFAFMHLCTHLFVSCCYCCCCCCYYFCWFYYCYIVTFVDSFCPPSSSYFRCSIFYPIFKIVRRPTLKLNDWLLPSGGMNSFFSYNYF